MLLYAFVLLSVLYTLFCLSVDYLSGVYMHSFKKIRPEFFKLDKPSLYNMWMISLIFPIMALWPGGTLSYLIVFFSIRPYRAIMAQLCKQFYPQNANVAWWRNFVKNPVDGPFFGLLLFIVTQNVLFIALCSLSRQNVWIILPFYLSYQEAFGLSVEWLFHWDMHLDVFKHRISWLALQSCAVLFGYIPNVYKTNHLLIHHKENNGPEDFQSTSKYNRASILEFSVYILNMWINYTTCIGVYRYLIRKIHQRTIRTAILKMFLGQVMFIVMLVTLWSIRPALLVLIFFTYAPAGFYISRGAWLWHSLIDPNNPQTVDTSTTKWNGYSAPFNDNLHSAHHKESGRHWSTLQQVQTSAPTVHINIMDNYLLYCFTRQFDLIAQQSSLADPDQIQRWLSPVGEPTASLKLLRQWSLKEVAESSLLFMYRKGVEIQSSEN